jgi:hypothetical protein
MEDSGRLRVRVAVENVIRLVRIFADDVGEREISEARSAGAADSIGTRA